MLAQRFGNLSRKYAVPAFSACLLIFACVMLVTFRADGPSRVDATTGLSQVLRTTGSQSATTGVTGKLFSGAAVRTLSADVAAWLRQESSQQQAVHIPLAFPQCKKWGVVTTIFEPSDAVQDIARRPDWCLVVVTDRGTPRYAVEGERVVVLDEAAQVEFGKQFPNFFALLPWKHFGRKNVGYLYAVSQQAEYVWDFDDDNIAKDASSLTPPENGQRLQQMKNCTTYNPYPRMGASPASWPRGYPLNLIKSPCPATFESASTRNVAIFQSLADNEPDVDGIFRLTQTIPFNFLQSAQDTIIIPKGFQVPFNAQATLFRGRAMWGLLLPVSVHGRVSDIWRSYFTQRLLWETGDELAFTPPKVVQIRNPHNPLADMRAEDDLYFKSLELTRFLNAWTPSAKTLGDQILDLSVQLYERSYIEVADVLLTFEWVRALRAIGYRFPQVLSTASR